MRSSAKSGKFAQPVAGAISNRAGSENSGGKNQVVKPDGKLILPGKEMQKLINGEVEDNNQDRNDDAAEQIKIQNQGESVTITVKKSDKQVCNVGGVGRND